MQVSCNEQMGIDAVCGVVIKTRLDNRCLCFFENGKFIITDSAVISHVDEDMYQTWKKNGIETHKTVMERTVSDGKMDM
jgi:hypothetical protein